MTAQHNDQRPERELKAAYLQQAETKVVVKAKNETALERIAREASSAGVTAEMIRDAGRSELAPGTATVVAFGPAYRDELPAYLARLPLWED